MRTPSREWVHGNMLAYARMRALVSTTDLLVYIANPLAEGAHERKWATSFSFAMTFNRPERLMVPLEERALTARA